MEVRLIFGVPAVVVLMAAVLAVMAIPSLMCKLAGVETE